MTREAESSVKQKPEVCFVFSDDSKKDVPDKFNEMRVGDTVKVTVKGKVRSLRMDTESKSFSITMDQVKLVMSEKVKGVADTLEDIEKERKT